MGRDGVGDEVDVVSLRHLAVGVALELLERDRLAPQQRDVAVGPERDLRVLAGTPVPLEVRTVGVVPVGDDGLEAGFEVDPDETG